jgi:hypothetical protein
MVQFSVFSRLARDRISARDLDLDLYVFSPYDHADDTARICIIQNIT